MPTKAVLETENAELKEELKRVLLVNTRLTEEIEKLSSQPVKKSAPAAHSLINLSFVYEGGKFGFTAPFMHVNGSKISAQDVCDSKDLQKELVEKKIGMIKKL